MAIEHSVEQLWVNVVMAIEHSVEQLWVNVVMAIEHFHPRVDGSPRDLHELYVASTNSGVLAEFGRMLELHRFLVHAAPRMFQEVIDYVNVPNEERNASLYDSDYVPPRALGRYD